MTDIRQQQFQNILTNICQNGCRVEISANIDFLNPEFELLFPLEMMYRKQQFVYHKSRKVKDSHDMFIIKNLDNEPKIIRLYVHSSRSAWKSYAYRLADWRHFIVLYLSPSDAGYSYNNYNLDLLINSIHDNKSENYRQTNLKNFMLTCNFHNKEIIYLTLIDKFFDRDIKKKLIHTLLIIGKWHNLGFYVS